MTKSRFLKAIIFIVAIILTAWIYIVFSFYPDSPCGVYAEKEIYINELRLVATIANNDCKRALGLSDHNFLEPEKGMLFVYDTEGVRGIWMKDMKFPIDILWLNKEGVVVGVHEFVSPETYPKVFGEQFKAKYVLELSSGFVLENSIKNGDQVLIK